MTAAIVEAADELGLEVEIPVVEEGQESGPPPHRRGGGPKTPEGKANSARNALKHGLRSKSLLPEEMVESIERRRDSMFAEYGPETPNQEDVLAGAARAAVLLEHCQELLLIDLGRLRDEVETTWDIDRELDAAELFSKLPGDPVRVSKALASSPQGADLMIRYWHGLLDAARRNGRWDEAQRALAFDLLGTPAALRSIGFGLGGPDATAADLIETAEREIDFLEAMRDTVLANRDASWRRLTRRGMPMLDDRVTARLRRYEATYRRAYHAALAEFRRLKPEPEKPKPKARSKREPQPESRRIVPEPHPATMASLPPIPPPEAIFRDPPPPRPAAPAPAPPPAPAPALLPAPEKPMNRRARKAQQKRERLAAKRAGR